MNATNEENNFFLVPDYGNGSLLLNNTLNADIQRQIDLYTSLSKTFSILCPIIFGVSLLIGITGNGMVIYVILANKYLRTCPNMLFLNLAIADLLFLVFCVPLQTALYIREFHLLIGEALCKLFKYTIYVTMSVSAYSLMVICVFRCIAVAFPLHTSRILTKKYALVASGVIWSSMLAFNSPIMLYYTEQGSFACAIPYVHKNVITTITVGVDFMLPMSICFIGTGFIINALRRNQDVLREVENETMERIENSRRSTRKLVILVVSVAVVFFVCWAPFLIIAVLNVLSPIGKHSMDIVSEFIVSFVAQILAFSNSCVNPIIYNFVSTDFRRAFRGAVKCRFRRALHHRHSETTRSEIFLREKSTLVRKSNTC